ncbi:DUF1156 domain-containing protein [Leucobacter soli]|uniref:DUF1156 domain-containing protein n=1 Tax=Leucobacter soli TaxID=2812850 RepID=UPI00360C0220
MAKKKLIEVALPLDAINAQSAREKSIRHGHPSTLHLWWARRPWRRLVRCSSRSSWTIPRRARTSSATRRSSVARATSTVSSTSASKPNGSACSISSLGW